jgi:hypothetical protein
MKMFKLFLPPVILLVGSMTGAAFAQADNSRVLVPGTPEGAIVSGCFRADRGLFGPNRLSFCLQRRGTYEVRGDRGIRCDGRLTWSASGNNVRINLQRARCTRGLDWSAARIDCRQQGALERLLTDIMQGGRNQRVLVPHVGSMRCTYRPTVRGERDTTFVARRLRR